MITKTIKWRRGDCRCKLSPLGRKVWGKFLDKYESHHKGSLFSIIQAALATFKYIIRKEQPRTVLIFHLRGLCMIVPLHKSSVKEGEIKEDEYMELPYTESGPLSIKFGFVSFKCQQVLKAQRHFSQSTTPSFFRVYSRI